MHYNLFDNVSCIKTYPGILNISVNISNMNIQIIWEMSSFCKSLKIKKNITNTF